MAFPQAFMDELTARNDIVDVVGSYVTLTSKSGSFWGCCPFHNEKTPSFHVNPARQTFHCFGCGVGGDAIKFLMMFENLDYPTALRRVADRNGIAIIETIANLILVFIYFLFLSALVSRNRCLFSKKYYVDEVGIYEKIRIRSLIYLLLIQIVGDILCLSVGSLLDVWSFLFEDAIVIISWILFCLVFAKKQTFVFESKKSFYILLLPFVLIAICCSASIYSFFPFFA